MVQSWFAQEVQLEADSLEVPTAAVALAEEPKAEQAAEEEATATEVANSIAAAAVLAHPGEGLGGEEIGTGGGGIGRGGGFGTGGGMEANLRAAPIEARRPTGHRDMQVGDEAGGLPEDIASIAPFVSARMNKHHLPTFARWVAALRPCSTQNTVESLRPVLTLSQGLLRDLVDGKIQFQDEEVRRARAECERRLVELREIHALEVSRMEERHAKAMEELMATYQTDVAERRKKMVLSAAFGAVDEARLIDEAVAESMAADELEKELSRLRETSEAEIARLKSDLEIQAKLKNELAENINVMRREHDTKRDELQHTIDELARKIELLNGQNFSLQSHIIDLEDELKRVPRQLPSPDVNLGDLLTTTAYRKIKSMTSTCASAISRVTSDALKSDLGGSATSSELLLFVFARLREEEEEEDVRGWYGVTGSEAVADGEDNEEEANMDGGIKGGLGVISAMVTRRSVWWGGHSEVEAPLKKASMM
ncbi:hypothetical protein PPROV_001022900 [Pycnococcus provasolii]|uniref:Uncharacterized protein n=1 Tax=Pycnococcus provasolii TaxID=41880 RepID=A0A830I1A4_9CHLO|nr:hypothetical protein PPROV_001022900 [Pycnococcus provasolii]